MRRTWVDRGRLLRGADALRALGLTAPPPEPPPRFPPAPGPTADRLLAAYEDRESGEFDALAGALIEAGRGDVLDLAVRKVRARQSDENAAELWADMLAVAAGAAVGPSGWAELVALPVALPPGAVPDAVALADGLIASGGLAPEEELRVLPGWRSPDAVAELSPVAMRRVLLDLVADREPRDLPPGDTDELARRGFGVLVGVRVDWGIPIWDVIEAEGGLAEEAPGDDETPEERGRARALDRWRSRVAADHGGCVPLDLVPLSEVGGAIAEFLDEAGGHLEGVGRDPGVRRGRPARGRRPGRGVSPRGHRGSLGAHRLHGRGALPGQPDPAAGPAARERRSHARAHRHLRSAGPGRAGSLSGPRAASSDGEASGLPGAAA